MLPFETSSTLYKQLSHNNLSRTLVWALPARCRDNQGPRSDPWEGAHSSAAASFGRETGRPIWSCNGVHPQSSFHKHTEHKTPLQLDRCKVKNPKDKGVRWGWGLHHRFWFLNHRGRLQQSKSNQVSEFSNRAPLASTNKKTIPRALPGHLKGVLSIFVPPASGKGQHQKDQTCT